MFNKATIIMSKHKDEHFNDIMSVNAATLWSVCALCELINLLQVLRFTHLSLLTFSSLKLHVCLKPNESLMQTERARVCVCVLQVFWTETEAGSADLGSSPPLAASLLHQGECSWGSDLRLQRGHHASATRYQGTSKETLRNKQTQRRHCFLNFIWITQLRSIICIKKKSWPRKQHTFKTRK